MLCWPLVRFSLTRYHACAYKIEIVREQRKYLTRIRDWDRSVFLDTTKLDPVISSHARIDNSPSTHLVRCALTTEKWAGERERKKEAEKRDTTRSVVRAETRGRLGTSPCKK